MQPILKITTEEIDANKIIAEITTLDTGAISSFLGVIPRDYREGSTA